MARRKLFGWFGRPRFALALIAFAVSVGTGGAQAEERDRPIEIAQAVRPDPAAVFAGLKPLADKGDADAQARVAAFYCAGVGVAKNVVECIRYYRLAADSGNTRAQVNLAARYQRRLPLYRLAHATINADNLSPDEAATSIIRAAGLAKANHL